MLTMACVHEETNSVRLLKTVKMPSMESEVEENSRDGEIKGTKRKISLSTCAVCGFEEARYTCPRCLIQSCSLLCVKKHKEDSDCSGVRDKTAFVALSQFDEMTLLNDYRFLEDTGRFSDGANRDAFIKVPHVTMKAKCFMSNARKMNITLRLLPCTFSKSKENSTFFYSKEKRFMWHLKLIFPQSSAEFTQRRVSDQLTLQEILIPYIHPTDSDPVSRQKLKMYVLEPFEHVKVFMKAEGRKANSVRYHELDLQKTLRDNLSYKTLIEYPVLHVVLRGHWEDYPLKGPAEQSSNTIALPTKRGNHHNKHETSLCLKTSTGSPDIDLPRAKRAKREDAKESKEDGELSESSDEDEDSSSSESSDTSERPTEQEMLRMDVSNDVASGHKENADSEVTNTEQGSDSSKMIQDMSSAPDGTRCSARKS
uniref:Box C/D snoRNA protein 1 n=1 Tax=Neogobius melanostomus TaxID=47308 RepID=A0A8C6WM06_9GOBI